MRSWLAPRRSIATYRDYVASVIPAWIPAHMFWAYATGVAHLAAGAGIVQGSADQNL
jgi:hypothetical protein